MEIILHFGVWATARVKNTKHYGFAAGGDFLEARF
jgi:hypothetical protein